MTRKFEGKELVVATHNGGKLREISALLAPYVETFYSAGELGLPEPEETGNTFKANAILKAQAAANASGKPALADDSGLAVVALNGNPGIYSARWGGEAKDFNLAMKKVHDKLGNASDRSAYFVCALALAWPDGGTEWPNDHTEVFEGRVNGVITWPMRGSKGFGYDAIFVPNGYDMTFAEMEPDAKHKISHRADAFAQLVAGCLGQ